MSPVLVAFLVIISIVFSLIVGFWLGHIQARREYGDHRDSTYNSTSVEAWAWQQTYWTIINHLVYYMKILERAVYLSEGTKVDKEIILRILIGMSRALQRKGSDEDTERSSVHRYRDNRITPEGEQAIVSWARGLEERSYTEAHRDSGMG